MASSSRTDETSRSTTTAGPSGAAPSAAREDVSGSGASHPAAVCPGGLNGRLSRCRSAIGQLLLLAERRQLDNLQPLAHRLRDRAGIGRRHDPQDRGQVEPDIEVRVAKRLPAGGVEQVEQGMGGIGVHPVDRLEDEHRVAHAGCAQAGGDAAGHTVPHPVDQGLGVLLPSGTCTWVRPSAAATATASDVLPVPQAPARQSTGAGPRAHDQRRRRVRLRFQAPVGAFDGKRATGLRARRQRVEDAGLHFLEAAVRAVQRLLQSCPGEPIRLARHGSDRTISVRSSTSSTAYARSSDQPASMNATTLKKLYEAQSGRGSAAASAPPRRRQSDAVHAVLLAPDPRWRTP